jgi:hypothetical protein
VYVLVYRSADAHYISVISFIFYNEKLCCECEQICSVIFRYKEAGIKFPQLRNEVTASITNKEEI